MLPQTYLEEQRVEGDSEDVELSPEMREELLDPEQWGELLSTYSRTVGMAVAMTDCEGRQSGICHNPQPTWLRAHNANPAGDGAACSFCVDPSVPCEAVRNALSIQRVVQARDRIGLVHLAVPITLGRHRLGALIAGQVFDLHPEPLRLARVARKLGIPTQQFWHWARLQSPIRNSTLTVYGELLFSLGKAFLRERYAAILDRKLARTNLRLRLLLDGVKGHALFTIDAAGLVSSWNYGAERLFGHAETDVIGKDYSLLFTPEDILAQEPGKLLKQAGYEGWANHEGWQVRKDGTRFFAEGSLAALGKGDSREFGRLTNDVTDRRKAEEALRHTQKLESIGVLASGIAHDFNNLLSGILGGVSFAITCLPADHPAVPSLALAEQASEKAADLTRQLLAYGGQGKFIITPFDLSALIRDMLKLLQTSIPKSVDLQLALESDLPWIEADASQIQQIVMNLVINGAESIGPEGGWLRVSTGSSALENRVEGRMGVEVWMEVQDTGSGMTDATKARIFDPFFTTKFTGRGLGLAAVSGIVRGHEGRMQVESAIGKGSTFRIFFPAVERRGRKKEKLPSKKQEHCSGTVLVVDDEPAIRMLAKAILERSGYKIIMAENGRDAVDLFQRHADSITTVLLDLTMPVMSGEKAFRLIREIRPNMPIVVSTGYSEVATQDLFASDTMVGFIQKPYSAVVLCERIRATSLEVPPFNGRA